MKTKHFLTRFSFLLVLVIMILAACSPAASMAAAPADVALAESAQTDGLPALPLEIGAYQAADFREKGAFILDVRENDEWIAGHIPGATLIPLGQLENRLDEVPADQSIVVVCRTGNRSAVARDILLEAGFESVTSMYGGFVAWEKEGYEVEQGQ
jgi:rhodanese-related sulfurtransferase